MKKIFLICMLALAVLFSCRTDKDPVDSILYQLTKNNWKRSATDKNPNSNPGGNSSYAPLPDCEKDNIYTFNYSNQLKIDSGEVQCRSSEERIGNVDFTIDDDGKNMRIKGAPYQLIELRDDQLKLNRPLLTSTGVVGIIYLFEPAK